MCQRVSCREGERFLVAVGSCGPACHRLAHNPSVSLPTTSLRPLPHTTTVAAAGEVGFSTPKGGGFNRAPQNWGGGVRGKGTPLSCRLWKGAQPHDNFNVLIGLTRCFWRSTLCHRRALFCPHCTWLPRFGFASQSVWVGVRFSGSASSVPSVSDRVSSGLDPQVQWVGPVACPGDRQRCRSHQHWRWTHSQPQPTRIPHRRPRLPLSGQRYAVPWLCRFAGGPSPQVGPQGALGVWGVRCDPTSWKRLVYREGITTILRWSLGVP